jgi:hypothetical protein
MGQKTPVWMARFRGSLSSGVYGGEDVTATQLTRYRAERLASSVRSAGSALVRFAFSAFVGWLPMTSSWTLRF